MRWKSLAAGIVIGAATVGAAHAEETAFEPRLSVVFPYLLEPERGIGDTTLGVGMDFQIRPPFLVSQGFLFGLLGRHRIRYEAGPAVRLWPKKRVSVQATAAGIAQMYPQSDGGFGGRLGLTWDASRLLRTWYIRLALESGLAVLLRQPRMLEWQVARISVLVPF